MTQSVLPLFPEAVEVSGPVHQFCEVVFDRPLDHAYSYGVPESLADVVAVGKRVTAPFGRGDRQTTGFCVGVGNEPPTREVKSIVQVLDDEPIFTPQLLRLTRWMADYYMCGWGQVLNAVVPAGVKRQAGTREVILIELVAEMLRPSPPPTLTARQQLLLDVLVQQA